MTINVERFRALFQMRSILYALREQAFKHKTYSRCKCVNAKFRDKFLHESKYALKHYPENRILEKLRTKYPEEFGDE